jgi:acyl-CoA reductase-like NAD-dependent aldehyde dehydrogenase
MNKSEQREVAKVRQIAKIQPQIAAGMIAVLHRAALTSRSQREIVEVMEEEELMQHLTVVNGCYCTL